MQRNCFPLSSISTNGRYGSADAESAVRFVANELAYLTVVLNYPRALQLGLNDVTDLAAEPLKFGSGFQQRELWKRRSAQSDGSVLLASLAVMGDPL
ncbi:hypothetical protein CBR_g51390 [Chara braunii]|uniref:Uncharacterized protein n=1 Tax=Chara braunii TaxID=69332 RepID=A0A388M8R1_CHABU|nr:hypothetical protein CBR_g51389 [Chara braunii]GBG90883.1 hypothetical protein CBR_g51390 [Chara braunii]|eukprot:GBG90882.1 hypothetical protein CBR_g51389 [Chara braunii]